MIEMISYWLSMYLGSDNCVLSKTLLQSNSTSDTEYVNCKVYPSDSCVSELHELSQCIIGRNIAIESIKTSSNLRIYMQYNKSFKIADYA